jgi:hypothetical protein
LQKLSESWRLTELFSVIPHYTSKKYNPGVNKNIDQLIQKLKAELGQPFPGIESSFDNELVFVAGLSGIVFNSLVAVRTIFP